MCVCVMLVHHGSITPCHGMDFQYFAIENEVCHGMDFQYFAIENEVCTKGQKYVLHWITYNQYQVFDLPTKTK